MLENDLIAPMREVEKGALRQRDAEVSQRLVRIRAAEERGTQGIEGLQMALHSNEPRNYWQTSCTITILQTYTIPTPMRIAILEDDPSQLELLSHWVSGAGHQAVTFERGEDFLKAIGKEQFEILILDWNLPDATGVDVLRRVRQTSKVPALFCTARADQDDVVKALREGADDYLIKPLRRLELLARIESVARRGRSLQSQDETFEVDDLRVDYASRAISRDGAVFELTDKDFDLAVLFMRNVGRLLPRSHIHEAVWGTIGAVTSRTLDTHVSRIRNKLGLLPKNGWQLKSVYGHGYRLEQIRRDARVEEAA